MNTEGTPVDRVAELRAAGVPLVGLDDDQLEVVRQLTDDEVKVLTDVHLRFVEAGPEVTAHTNPMTIGGLFF